MSNENTPLLAVDDSSRLTPEHEKARKLFKICFGLAIGSCLITILFMVLGIAGPQYFNSKLNHEIHTWAIVDGFNATSYSRWASNTQHDSAKIWTKFYIFNVTNPEEAAKGKTPIVKEIGPYSYRKYFQYINVSFSSDFTEVSWKKWQYYMFDPSTSFPGASENDILTVLNVPFQWSLGALLYTSSNRTEWARVLSFDVLAAFAGSTSPFVQKTANEIIFGYEDLLLHQLSWVYPDISLQFGMKKNSTLEEALAMPSSTTKTGRDNWRQITNLVKWRNQTKLDCWGSKEANTVQGKDGSQFWPGIERKENPQIWIEELERSTYLESAHETTVKDINLWKFTIALHELANAYDSPDNAAYYQYGYSGVFNQTSCYHGAPFYYSKPHFLHADTWYTQQVIGLHPQEDKHEMSIDVEPIVGVTMRIQKRLQLNVKILFEPLLVPDIVHNTYLPYGWFEEIGMLSDEQAEAFKSTVYKAKSWTIATRSVGLGVGSLMAVVSIALIIKTHKLRAESKPVRRSLLERVVSKAKSLKQKAKELENHLQGNQ